MTGTIHTNGKALARVLTLLEGRGPVEKRGTEYRCLCPAHADTHPSLDVRAGDGGRVLFQCRSRQCPAKDICAALGLSLADLFDGDAPSDTPFEDRIVCTYDYRNAAGVVAFQTVRLCAPKDFRQRKPDGRGGWEWNLRGVALVPYRLPELLASGADVPVYIVEGEKDADALAALGLVATTNPMGAGKWKAEYAPHFKGRAVVILPDNDEPGQKHAEAVKRMLTSVAASVVVVPLPDLPEKGDVSDWLRTPGNDAIQLAALAYRTAHPQAEPWDDPIPLESGIQVPPFPADLFPDALARFFRAVGTATNSPPDYVGTMAIGILSGAIGAAYALDVKEGYTEPTSLYTAAVARKGDGKTPALSHLIPPLVAEQVKRREAGIKAPAFVDDATVEKMTEYLQKWPRGLLMVRDELSALLGGFNQYKAKGQGADRSFYLKAHSGTPVQVGRKDKDAEEVFVPHPCLSITGGIQPTVLARYTADSDDGLFDRFLFCYPDPLPMAGENGASVPCELRTGWARVVGALYALTMHEEGTTTRPHFLKLDARAWGVWVEWTKWLAGAVNGPEFPEELRGPAAKIRGLAGRLAVVFFTARRACGEELGPFLDDESMRRGAALAKYFFGHARRVWRLTGHETSLRDAKKVLAFVERNEEDAFSLRDAYRALHSSFANPDALWPAFRLLTQHGFIRRTERGYAGTGRKGSALFERHPSLRDTAQKRQK